MSVPPGDASFLTAGEVSRNFGAAQDKAHSGPVVVTHRGRPRVVILSAESYARLGTGESGPAPLDSTSEGQLSAVLNHTSEGFLACDDTLRVTSVNVAFEDLVGRPEARLVGRPLAEALPESMTQLFGDQMRRVLRTGESTEFETVGAGEDRRHYCVRVFPYPGGVGLLVLNKSEEQSLRRESELARATRAALSYLPNVAMIKLNVRGVFAVVDANIRQWTGLSSEQLNSIRLIDIVSPRDRPAVIAALEGALDRRERLSQAARLVVRGGEELPVMLEGACVYHDGWPVGVAVALTLEPGAELSAAAE